MLLDFPGFEKGKLAFQFEDLLEIRPIQEILKLAAHGEVCCSRQPNPSLPAQLYALL